MLSGVSLLAVSNVNNPVGLVGFSCVMWSAHFFVTHIETEKISSWNGPTVHVCCFMLVRASTKTLVSRVRKTAIKSSLAEKFVSRAIRWPRYHCILWLLHFGISCTVFVLICTVVVLYCFVMCVCMYVCVGVHVCVCVGGCVCVGFVVCACVCVCVFVWVL
jgi:hypothetical protein